MVSGTALDVVLARVLQTGDPGGHARRALAYRCAAEPVAAYVRKGGNAGDAKGRQCLCNGLLATIGLAQRRPGGRTEPPLVTIGKDLSFLPRLSPAAEPYTAADVVRWLEAGGGVGAGPE